MAVNLGNDCFYVLWHSNHIKRFFEILLKSWGKESAYPSAQEDSAYCLANDPTYGQCAVTAMLVNKFLVEKSENYGYQVAVRIILISLMEK